MGQMYFPGEGQNGNEEYEIAWGRVFFAIVVAVFVGYGIYWLVTSCSSSSGNEVAVEEMVSDDPEEEIAEQEILLNSTPMGQMFFPDDNLSSPTVKIEKIWLTHHTSTLGRKELHVHTKFQINFALGRGCRAIAYFYNSDGYPLWDRNKEYYAENGQVSSGEDFTPPYEYCRYDDFVIMIPYKELHTPGSYLKVCVSVITKSDSKFLSTSEYAHFYIPY